MRLQTLIFTTLLVTSLAGCLESGDEAPAPAVVEETQSLDTNVTNLAPVAELLVDVVNGTAPLNVTFTLDASDADGDNLTWSFDDGAGNTTDGNGSALPATVNVTYLAGNWSAVFTVSDGSNETVETTNVTVAAGAAAFGPVPEDVVFEGSFIATPDPGLSYNELLFDPAVHELEVTPVAAMTLTLEFSEGAAHLNDLDWYISDPSGAEVHEGTNGGGEDPVTFDVPAPGTWTIKVDPWSVEGTVDYTVTVSFA